MKYAIVLALLLTSCASYKMAVKKDIVNKAIVENSYDKTWSGVVKFFASKNIPIKTIDKASGLIATDNMMFSTKDDKHLFECDALIAMGNEITRQGKASFNVYIEKISDKKSSITVNSNSFYIVPPTQYVVGGEVPCFSNGGIEKEIFNAIK